MFEYLYIAVKFVFVNLYKLLKLIFASLRKVFKRLFSKLHDGTKVAGTHLKKGFLFVFKLLGKIPLYLWIITKFFGLGLYTIFVYPFVYLYKAIKRMLYKTISSVKINTHKFFKAMRELPHNIREKILAWFNNISFIKDMHNKKYMKRQALLIDFDSEDAVRSEQKILYRYVAKNPNGKIEKGKLSAYSKLDVHSYLLSEGYEVYEIEVFKGLNITLGTHYKIKSSELVFFLTQLSTYIKAGIPLVDSIKVLSRQVKQANKRDLYKAIIYELTMGDSFSESLERQGSSFPRLLVNMIKSAELAGNLSETLDDMADYYDSVSKTKKQMLSAMTYPAVITTFALAVVTFIMVYVIPQFVGIYKDINTKLPTITIITISLSNFLAKYLIYLILGLIVVIVGLIFLYRNVKMFRLLVQWILMHIPVVGNIIIYNEVTMFSKTFGSLLNHNVFITDSMEILSKITNNEVYKMLIFDTITNLAKGEAISNSFKDQWAFPLVAYEMLVTGERTGQPGTMMNKVAEFYQEEHKNSINQIKAFIEPVMIIFLALVVGVILLSVVLPMFNMYSALGTE